MTVIVLIGLDMHLIIDNPGGFMKVRSLASQNSQVVGVRHRRLHAILCYLTPILVVSGVAACGAEDGYGAAEAACDFTPPVVEGIALALGIIPHTSPAAVVLSGIAGVVVSQVCKEVVGTDTDTQSKDDWLRGAPYLPISFRLPNDATICLPGEGKYGSVAAGTDVTTCQFSKNVRSAFLDGGAVRGLVYAYSPVTEQLYSMDCDGTYPVACTGGKNALVYIY